MNAADLIQPALKADYMIGNKAMPAGRQGFTLVELLVGVAVFALVILITAGLLINVLSSQRKSMSIQNVQDNGRYLMAFVAKEIRMSDFNVSDGEAAIIDINHPTHGNITYSFSGNHILRNNEILDSDEVNVNGRFVVDGKTGGDNEQPQVTIVMKVETIGTKAEERTEINLQTTLSQRRLD